MYNELKSTNLIREEQDELFPELRKPTSTGYLLRYIGTIWFGNSKLTADELLEAEIKLNLENWKERRHLFMTWYLRSE